MRQRTFMVLTEQLPPNLKAQLVAVKEAAVEIWNAPQHRHYTDHKPEKHSERIIKKLDAMAQNMEPPLATTEIFILLASAYLHDIGMQYRHSTELSLDDVRNQHHTLSRQMIEGSISDTNSFRTVGLKSEFADEVALVSEAHRKVDLAAPQFDPLPKGDQVIRLRLLSAMLRLADALDLDYNRVIMDNLKLEDVGDSRLHWWRCHYVDGVNIHEGSIDIACAVPSEDYGYYIRASLENEVRSEVENVRPFLWPQIKLAVGNVTVRVSATKQKMSASDFDLLRTQVRKEVEKSSQSTNDKIVEMRSREERAAVEAASEGRRLSGSDPPAALELLQQASHLFQRLGQPHAVAAQLEAVGDIHKKREEWAQYCAVHEHLGNLYLAMEEPFRAKWAFVEAHEKTLLDGTWPQLEDQIRRGLQATCARMLWGEFEGAQKYLDEVKAALQGQNSPIIAIWYAAQLQLHQCQNQWRRACQVARNFISDLEAMLPSADKEAHLAAAAYEMSLVASLAGEHQLASEWIERAFAFDELCRASGDTPEGNLPALHARRGILRWRVGRRGAALKDIFEAVRCAERLGDDLTTLIQLENAVSISNENFTPHHPFIQQRWDRMRDLDLQYGEVRGLPPDIGGDKLADNLSASLIAVQKSLTRNDIRGLARARLSLARIYQRSDRPREALAHLIVAGVGRSKEINDVVAELIEKSESQTSEMLRELSEEVGSTNAETASLGAAIEQAADLLPDDVAEPLVARFLEQIEPSSAAINVNCAVLPAIGQLAARLSQDTVERVARLTLILLKGPRARQHEVRSAAAKIAVDLATQLPLGVSLQERLSYDIRCQLVECLIPLLSDEVMGRDALLALLHVGLLPSLQAEKEVTSSITPNRDEQEEELRLRVSEELRVLAIDKRQTVELGVYVSAEIGPLPDDFARSVLLHFSKQATEELEMAETSHFNLSSHATSLIGLKSFASLIEVDVLSTAEATQLFESILKLAQHPDNMISRREGAIHVLGLLADPLSNLQKAEQLPGDFISRVVATACNIVRSPNLGVMVQMLAQGATDPLNRFKFNDGNIVKFGGVALRALGRFTPYLSLDDLQIALKTIDDGVNHSEAEVRDSAAFALRQAHSVLNKTQRHESLMRLHALLYDGDPDVRHTALFALGNYGVDLEAATAPLLLQRVTALCIAPQSKVRHNALYLLQAWSSLPIFEEQKQAITNCLEEMQKDISFDIRQTATMCLMKITNAELDATTTKPKES